MSEYFALRHVPKCCPVCGATVPDVSSKSGFDLFFTFTMSGWQIHRYKKHPVWRFQYYKVYCMDCIFREEIMKKDYVLKNVPKQTWQPASIVVPFGVKNDR